MNRSPDFSRFVGNAHGPIWVASQAARWLGTHVFVLFLLWSFWLVLEYLVFGPFSFVRVWEDGDAYIPARLGVVRSLEAGKFGYWSQQWGSGTDVLASGLSPLSDLLLFLLAPGWLAYGIFMWIQRLVAGYFTYRLCKDSLNLSTLASIFAGLAYALLAQNTIDFFKGGGFMFYDGLGLPGLPFLLWAFDRLSLRSNFRLFLYAAGFGILLSATSYVHFTVLFIPFLLYWFLFIKHKPEPRFWAAFLLFASTWMLAELAVIWPTILNAPLSHRNEWAPGGPVPIILQGPDIARMLRVLIWDNVASIGLLTVGVIVSYGRDRRLLLLWAAMVLCVGFMIGSSFIQLNYHDKIGFLAGYDFSRVHLLLPFLLMVSGAVGLHLIASKGTILKTSQTSHYRRQVIQIALAFALFGLMFYQSLNVKFDTVSDVLRGINSANLYEHPNLQDLADRQPLIPPSRVATVVAAEQFPAFAWAYGLETADGYVNLYSRRYKEFWEQVIGPLAETDHSVYNKSLYWGSQFYLFPPTHGFPGSREWRGDIATKSDTANQVQFVKYYDLELLSLANVRFIISPIRLADDRLVLLASNVRSDYEGWKNQSNIGRLLWTFLGRQPFMPLNIYENLTVLPRFFVAGRARVFDESTAVLKALGQASHQELRSTVYVTKADANSVLLDGLESSIGEVNIRVYEPDRIVLDVDASAAGILVITNNFSPYWKARVDNKEAIVFPVDHTFQGVYIDAGENRVVLEYRPPYAIRFRKEQSTVK